MGMNYYAHFNVCDKCGKPEHILHIGKSSHGWTFSFRGYNEIDTLAIDEKIKTIKSYKDWLDVILAYNPTIKNEEGDMISLQEFMRIVLDKSLSPNNHAVQYKEGTWLDEFGNSFTGREFC